MSEQRDIHIPKLGPGTVEADLVRVDVAIGDRVTVGQTIAEVEGEKASFTVESPVEGTIAEILLAEGETHPIGDVICRIDVDG